jgi:hypothetical protein
MSKFGQAHIPPLPTLLRRHGNSYHPLPPIVCQLPTWVSASHSPLWFALAGCSIASCHTASTPPAIFTMRCLLLLSSSRATSTSHHLEVSPAFETPPPLVCWCLWLVVTMPLFALLLLLVLSTIHCLLSGDASPPVGLLFASWLSRPCTTAAASCRLHTLPPPCDEPPLPCTPPPPLVCWCLSSCLPLFHLLVVTSHLIALLPQVSILDPRLHSHRLVVASHLVALLLPPVLSSTPPPLDALATHLPFASRSPPLVAYVFDLVFPISRFMAICQGYAPTYLSPCWSGSIQGPQRHHLKIVISCHVPPPRHF